MSRVQLALNVANLDDAIDFYTKYFRVAPAKVRPGYANFAIDEPPLKLVLFEGGGDPGTINHLGVEVFTSDEVARATTYLASVGVVTDVEERTTCCHAVQDKVWVRGPDGERWETYVVLDDAGDGVARDGVGDPTASVPVDGPSTSCCGATTRLP